MKPKTAIKKNPAYGRPMQIVAPIPKTILLVRQNSSKIKLFFARQFYTLYEKKYSNLRPLLSISFPQ